MRATNLALPQRARALWERARREHSTPREIGLAIAVGVFAGCTPFLGFHMWIALGLSTLLRLNRLWAFAGSRVSILPIFAWVGFCEIESAHRLRTGAWASLAPSEVVAHGAELLTDWLIGTVPVGGGLALLAGALAYAVARRWPGDVTPRTRAGSRPPSSESPPSAPPTPIP
ncbi:MAG: DUF2062 domain-containing protein [Polyangiaceae bacterium]